jgi:predicted nucleotidyltransferase
VRVIEQRWLQAIEEWAGQTPAIRNVYIVGSRAKGKATEESDLDVAVQLVDGANLGDWIFLSDQWRAELQSKLDVKLHLLRGSEDLGNPTIAEAVKDHGANVYTRKESE